MEREKEGGREMEREREGGRERDSERERERGRGISTRNNMLFFLRGLEQCDLKLIVIQ